LSKEFIDIIIIGAGLSGIGAAYHLQKNCPDKSLVILEGRDAIGGTWDLFRYPGIRSDSDMYTYGYNFKPWTDRDSLASAEKILAYLDDTIEENQLRQKIRLNHKVSKLAWSSKTASWTLEVQVGGSSKILESNFVLCCSGYFDYQQGYQPEFKNKPLFNGTFIHPQHWPEDLDYANKNIVVIGSGATAVTLVPKLAEKANHVTMLQRSPTYIAAMPMQDGLLKWLYKFLPKNWVSRFARKRNILMSTFFYNYMVKFPERAKKMIRKKLDKVLSADIDRKHFTPDYNPWDQRLCLIPDGDLFHGLNSGKISIKTDRIDEFNSSGIKLNSGEQLDADIIVSATGLKIKVLADIELLVDNQPVPYGDRMFYRGVLLEGVPNLGFVFGYTNASWTLKVELVSQYVSRVINHMTLTQQSVCVPEDKTKVKRELFLNLTSGYIQRAQQQIPKQGADQPWRLDQNYRKDKIRLQEADIEDGILQFKGIGEVEVESVNVEKCQPLSAS